MKTEKIFLWAWGILFIALAISLTVVICGIGYGAKTLYASTKTEILVRADSLESQVQTPRSDLLLKAESIWSGREMKSVGRKANELLRAEHPVFYFVILKGNICWLLVFFLLIFPGLIWFNRLEVSPEWELIAEWGKERMEPFKNGYHFPFRYFGYFEEIAEVPMNQQTLHILSSKRDRVEKEVAEIYVYGKASDIKPGTGASLGLSYEVEFKCLDSSALVYYGTGDPYEYVVSVIEHHVKLYAKSLVSEVIIDHFPDQDLDLLVPAKVQSRILALTGIELISFIPGSVFISKESEADRSILEKEKREFELNRAKIKNQKQLENGKNGVLKAEFSNMEVIKNISKEKDQVLANKVKSIMTEAGVSGEEALKIVMKEKTLETVGAASKNGSIVYIDESSNGNGNLNQGAALGFAINATQKKP